MLIYGFIGIDNYIDMCGYAAIAGELVEKKKPKQLEFPFAK